MDSGRLGIDSRSNPQIELDLSQKHLLAELFRVDIMLERAVKDWQRAGQDPRDSFRGLYVSDAQAKALLSRPLATHWGETVSPDPEEASQYNQALKEARLQSKAFSQASHSQGHTPRLERLAQIFGLNDFEVDILLICLAPSLDLRYENLYGYLQDDVTRKLPSVNLVLNLLCDPGPSRLLARRYFSNQAPLIRHFLLSQTTKNGPQTFPLLNQMLSIDETLVTWLLGIYRPHADLGEHASLLYPEENESHLLQAGEAASHLDYIAAKRPIVALWGVDEAAQDVMASLVGAKLELPLLKVNLAAMISEGLTIQYAVRIALRDARLVGAIPFLAGWDACLQDDVPPQLLMSDLCAHPGMVIVSSSSPWRAVGVVRDREIFSYEFPIPSYSQRLKIWTDIVGQVQTEDRINIQDLAGQFQLTSGQISDTASAALDRAAMQERALTVDDLFAAARAYSNPRLARLARKITPRYGWEDIVLPGDQIALLKEIVATVRGRPQVLETWGVGRKLVSSRGVTALFAGPPGTGKTMGAEILAAELGLDLYKIDLSTVVSKYIGETEKNLERIFEEAETSNSILFFDEADALFGKRSEVRDSHDRYANIEISYLLQRMEAYDGVTILATNLRGNLDEAFTRRLGFSVEFPFPEVADRQRIWETLFPPGVPRAAELDFELLAKRFRIAGGNIRNILVNAAYLAAADGQSVTMKHLLHGTRRELQKMGRLVAEEDVTLDESG